MFEGHYKIGQSVSQLSVHLYFHLWMPAFSQKLFWRSFLRWWKGKFNRAWFLMKFLIAQKLRKKGGRTRKASYWCKFRTDWPKLHPKSIQRFFFRIILLDFSNLIYQIWRPWILRHTAYKCLVKTLFCPKLWQNKQNLAQKWPFLKRFLSSTWN